ncbi:MAG: hypothetical protein HYT81_06565 [Gemmatimonadetes bacterium]|nr:hypothetical protein [Gemmatimonadota bacterium]
MRDALNLGGICLLVLAAARAAPPAAAAQRAQPTFAKDIAPILYRQCLGCHRPDGSAPFSLLSYQDARDRAAPIAAAVEARRMPPWLPERGAVRFANERRLTGQEIALIRRWVEAGAPEGDKAALPPAPEFPDGWQLGEPDLVVELPAYRVPRHGTDVYRNLVVPLPIGETRYVGAVEMRPGNARVVHHARLMVDTTASSREMDAQDAEPGFDGMDVMSHAMTPGGFFLGWTPGKVPTRGADDMAWPIEPGTDLVLQLHLRPNGQLEVVRPLMGFHFAARSPARRPTLVLFNWKAIDIPPGKKDYVVADSYTLPVDVQVLGVYPHAHYLATVMDAFAEFPDGSERRLLRIKDWDFNWQDEYRYEEPILIPKGSTLTMRYVYDNSAGNPQNPNRPPKRVTYGPNSTDEMGDLILQVLPRTAEDRALLERDLAWKYAAQDAGWFADRELARGSLLALRGDYAQALDHFRAALDNRADARAHAALAGALAVQGEFPQALLHARAALQLQPEDALGLAAMARILAQHPDPATRNPGEARTLAGRAARAVGAEDAAGLEAVAAAYAATGARGRAARSIERAMAAATRAGDDSLGVALANRLEQYRRP